MKAFDFSGWAFCSLVWVNYNVIYLNFNPNQSLEPK